MTDDPNGADASGLLDIDLDLDDAERGIAELAEREADRAAYVLALIVARCPELNDEDLAVLTSQPDEPLTHEIAEQVLDVVLALDDRMAKLEASVLAGNDLIGNVWAVMQDYTLEQKIAMLERLEGLVAMEEASHAPIQ